MAEPFHGYWGSHFAIHFAPIIFILAPFYLIINGPLWLLYLQVLAVGGSAIPLYLISKKEFKDSHLPLIISIIYLLYRQLINGLMYDFHPEMLFPLFLFLSYYFLALKNKPALFFLFMSLSLFIKEDFSIYIFFFCLFMYFKIQSGKKIVILTALFSILYFLMTVGIIMPYFRVHIGLKKGFDYLGFWQNLGDNPLKIIENCVLHPRIFLNSIHWNTSVLKFSNFISPLLFIPLLSSFFILILPPLFILISSSNPLMSELGLYYPAAFIPFLFLALLYGLRNLKGRLYDKENEKNKKIFAAIMVLQFFGNVANTNWNLLKPSRYSAIKDYQTVKKIIQMIPPDVPVAALSSLVPHIPKRKNIYVLPEMDHVEYIIIHSGINPWPFEGQQLENYLSELSNNPQYTCIKSEGQIKLFKKSR